MRFNQGVYNHEHVYGGGKSSGGPVVPVVKEGRVEEAWNRVLKLS